MPNTTSTEFNLTLEQMNIIAAGLQLLSLNMQQMVLYLPENVNIGGYLEELEALIKDWDIYIAKTRAGIPIYN